MHLRYLIIQLILIQTKFIFLILISQCCFIDDMIYLNKYIINYYNLYLSSWNLNEF